MQSESDQVGDDIKAAHMKAVKKIRITYIYISKAYQTQHAIDVGILFYRCINNISY